MTFFKMIIVNSQAKKFLASLVFSDQTDCNRLEKSKQTNKNIDIKYRFFLMKILRFFVFFCFCVCLHTV